MPTPKSKTKTTEAPEAEILEDGSIVETESTDEPARVLRGAGGVPLRALCLRDEQDADGYHNLTPVQGGNVATRELSDEDYKTFVARNRVMLDAQKAPQAIEDQAIALANQNRFDEANALRDKSMADLRAANQLYITDNGAMLDKYVVGWDLKSPYASRGWKRLRGDDIKTITLDIVEKSSVGREDEGFLAEDLPAI